MEGIPVIDIADLRSVDAADRRRVAAEIGAACRSVGFFAVTGHGVPNETVRGAFAAARAFFAQPLAAKTALAMRAESGNRGYVGIGVEQLDEEHGDAKEAFDVSLQAPRPPLGVAPEAGCTLDDEWPELPEWRPAAEAYFAAVHALGTLLLRAFALDLHLDEDFFSRGVGRTALLRMLRYPCVEGSDVVVGAGEHTDYDNLTLLAVDGGASGLQVRRRSDGTWIDAAPPAGVFLCNVADCMQRWTGDEYVSTPHRVLVRPGAPERFSIALFLGSQPDVVVESLPVAAEGGRRVYSPVTAGEYLRRRLLATYPLYRDGPVAGTRSAAEGSV